MTQERYWVIGGDYSCLGFRTMRDGGAPEAHGPFESREDATAAWKRLSAETKARATARYAIASEQLTLPN